MILWTNMVKNEILQTMFSVDARTKLYRNPMIRFGVETCRWTEHGQPESWTFSLIKCLRSNILAAVNMCIDCDFLRCVAAQTCRSLLMFRMNALHPSSGYIRLREVTVQETTIVGHFLHFKMLPKSVSTLGADQNIWTSDRGNNWMKKIASLRILFFVLFTKNYLGD
jgi:hypothetical protein